MTIFLTGPDERVLSNLNVLTFCGSNNKPKYAFRFKIHKKVTIQILPLLGKGDMIKVILQFIF
ncbi:hypothetical protein GCM10008934_07210 [Virgibacillus salarius]